jgi:uncharacterized protein (TIRG00374 family)
MNTAQPEKTRRVPSWVVKAAAYGLSIACLVWVLHGYDVREIAAAMRTLEWKWVTLSVLADLAVYVVHAWRWNTLLSPVARLPFWRTVQAIYIGLFANEVLPLRTGEVIRCYLLAHWNNVLLSVSFGSAAVERVIDGFWMVGAFIVTAYFLTLPGYMVDFVQFLSVLLILCAGVLAYVILHKQHAHSLAKESRWAGTLRHLVEGLHTMGRWSSFSRTILISFVYLAVQVFSVWALMRAYALDLSVWAAAAVITIVRFGTVIPNAPGNIGLFQAATVLALTMLEVEKDVAKTFSFVMFVVLTLPLLIGGALAVALSGLNLKEIRRRAHAGSDAVPGDQSRQPVA